MTMTIKQKLEHAVTQYDRKQYEKYLNEKYLKSKRGYYNYYALGLYLIRVDDCCKAIEGGADIHKTLEDNFTGKLLEWVLKATGV